mgnify:CR=1 FL=1
MCGVVKVCQSHSAESPGSQHLSEGSTSLVLPAFLLLRSHPTNRFRGKTLMLLLTFKLLNSKGVFHPDKLLQETQAHEHVLWLMDWVAAANGNGAWRSCPVPRVKFCRDPQVWSRTKKGSLFRSVPFRAVVTGPHSRRCHLAHPAFCSLGGARGLSGARQNSLLFEHLGFGNCACLCTGAWKTPGNGDRRRQERSGTQQGLRPGPVRQLRQRW